MNKEEKIKIDFKLEDIPMIIETMEKLQQENKQLKEKIEKIEEVIKKHHSLHEVFFEDHICVDVEYIKEILKGDDK